MVFSSWWWIQVSVHTSGTHEKSRYLDKRWIIVFLYAVMPKTNSVHFFTSPAGRDLLLRRITLGSNHNTAHCSVKCSRYSLAVLHKAKFVFTLLISPGNILMTSEKNVQKQNSISLANMWLKKGLISTVNFIKDSINLLCYCFINCQSHMTLELDSFTAFHFCQLSLLFISKITDSAFLHWEETYVALDICCLSVWWNFHGMLTMGQRRAH